MLTRRGLFAMVAGIFAKPSPVAPVAQTDLSGLIASGWRCEDGDPFSGGSYFQKIKALEKNGMVVLSERDYRLPLRGGDDLLI